MLEELEKLWKELKKNNQKTEIRAIGRAKKQKGDKKQKTLKSEGESQLKEVKSSLSATTGGIEESVKGQFGKKIKQVLKEQNQTVDNF